MNHYQDGTTAKIETFAGKTVSSFFFPDSDEALDFVEIRFTDGTSLEFVSTAGEITFSTKERVNGELLEFMPGNINSDLPPPGEEVNYNYVCGCDSSTSSFCMRHGTVG